MVTDQQVSPAAETSVRPARRFAQFAALCVALSWVPWAVLAVLGVDVRSGAGQGVFAVAAAAPSLAALVLWLVHRRERVRGGRPAWWAILAGVVLGALAPCVAAVVQNGGDLAAIGMHAAVVAAGVGGPLGVLAYTLAAGPLPEEFGWRGYLQPRLRARFGPLGTTLILGVAWSVWHLPLFALAGTNQHAMGLASVTGICLLLSFVPFSFVILVVTERLRGGVWAAVGAHAGFDAANALLPPAGPVAAVAKVAVFLVLAVLLALLWKPARATAPSPAPSPAQPVR